METFDYQHWLSVASRHSRRSADAPDLLQDALLDAIRAGRTDFASDANQRWFAGVIRNRAAMTARSAARRNRREASVVETRGADPASRTRTVPTDSFIDTLPLSARSVAVLVVAGLNRDEIIAALKIAPTAFRQRLTTIRKAWLKLPADERRELSIDAPHHVNGIDLGLLRRALLAHIQRLGGIGTHDPDGHLIVFSDSAPSHSKSLRQQKRKETR